MVNKKGKKGFMAIKVDLEKVYDRLNLGFLANTLKDIGFPSDMVSIIMSCVFTCQMKIIWNGETSNSFPTSRGLRQGDPISPYLYVLCMERLTHLIQHAVNTKRWKPIQLSHNGPRLSHLFFADDLILFAEASSDQIGVIQSVLDLFCNFLGEKVNKEKTNLFCSSNVHPNVASALSNESGFPITYDLGKYLGILLHHKRVDKRNFRFIEDKLCRCLNKWKANFLSLAGRITLTKPVLNTIPFYYIQTNMLLNTVCENIDKISRDFIWNTKENSKGTHLVACEKICCPKNCGEVGIRKASLMNQSLLLKDGWGLINNINSLWARTLRSKYKCGEDVIPVISQRNCSSNLWRGICKTWKEVSENINWKIGDGRTAGLKRCLP